MANKVRTLKSNMVFEWTNVDGGAFELMGDLPNCSRTTGVSELEVA